MLVILSLLHLRVFCFFSLLLGSYFFFVNFISHFLGRLVRWHKLFYFHRTSALGNFLALRSVSEIFGVRNSIYLCKQDGIG
jgi:hypothetical protein